MTECFQEGKWINVDGYYCKIEECLDVDDLIVLYVLQSNSDEPDENDLDGIGNMLYTKDLVNFFYKTHEKAVVIPVSDSEVTYEGCSRGE